MSANLSCLEVDLGAIDHNVTAFRDAIDRSVSLCAVIKQQAYGLGAVPIAKRLAARGVELFAVWSPDEAAELTRAGLAVPSLVLMPVEQIDRTDVLYRAAVAGRLHLTIHSRRQLDAVEALGRTFGSPMPVHVELDTGMSRGGTSAGEADGVLRAIADMRYVDLRGVFTHASSASTDLAATARQFSELQQFLRRNAALISERTLIHFANTAATLRERRSHCSMVRVGLGLYGYGQDGMTGTNGAGVAPLQPVARWTSRIVHLRDIPAGRPVGYDATFHTDRDSRFGIVPVGYADGYPLALSNRAVVRVGRDLMPAAVRGAVNMDQLIVDLTDVPDAKLGSEVEIYSNDPDAPNGLYQLAELAEANIYELLARLSPRITRRYVTPAAVPGGKGHVATV